MRLPNRHWVLSDFGIAHLPGSARPKTGPLAGTPDFTAPEARHEPGAVTAAADAWSIGALARWFTAIQRDHRPTSAAGRFWWALIDGTLRLDAAARWSLPQIASYLNAPPASISDHWVEVEVEPTNDQCPRCRRRSGTDLVGRCRACAYLGED